jgi:hypothetical protein
MPISLRLSCTLLLLLALSACATQSLEQKILTADRSVTAILAGTDGALNSHLISSAQAQSVSAIAHQVNPLLDSARAAAAANDPANASRTLNLVNSLLAGLGAYVPPPATP